MLCWLTGRNGEIERSLEPRAGGGRARPPTVQPGHPRPGAVRARRGRDVGRHAGCGRRASRRGAGDPPAGGHEARDGDGSPPSRHPPQQARRVRRSRRAPSHSHPARGRGRPAVDRDAGGPVIGRGPGRHRSEMAARLLGNTEASARSSATCPRPTRRISSRPRWPLRPPTSARQPVAAAMAAGHAPSYTELPELLATSPVR